MTIPPMFCPNCGAQLLNTPQSTQPFGKTEGDPIEGWDCYCKGCGWSGDILPDGEGSRL